MYSSQVWRVARRRQKQMPGPWKQQVHIYPDVNFDPKYPGNFKSIQQCPPMRHVFFFFFVLLYPSGMESCSRSATNVQASWILAALPRWASKWLTRIQPGERHDEVNRLSRVTTPTRQRDKRTLPECDFVCVRASNGHFGCLAFSPGLAGSVPPSLLHLGAFPFPLLSRNWPDGNDWIVAA